MIKEIHFPHSLGLLYSAFTYYTGFKVNSGEYKVMGLAPYGEPKYVDKILRTDRPEGGRLVPPRPELLRLLHRPDDDEREVRRAVRRPAAQGRNSCPRSAHGPGGLPAGRHRGGRAALARSLARRRASRTCAWPAAWRSTASPTARCCATALREHLDPAGGRRRRRRAGRGARGYHLQGPAAHRGAGRRHAGSYLGPKFEQADIEARLTGPARSSRC
jgi:carbamoyltransferase